MGKLNMRLYANCFAVLATLHCPWPRCLGAPKKTTAEAKEAPASKKKHPLLGYQLGLEVGSQSGSITISYDTPSELPLDPGKCELKGDVYRCAETVQIDPSVGPAIFLSQAFERKGFWHFDLDIDVIFRKLETKEKTFQEPIDVAPSGYKSPPLKYFRTSLYGVNTDAYVEFGITPKNHWPDLIFEIGVGIQPMYGQFYLNNEKISALMLNSLIFVEGDLVVWRFGDGYLEFFVSAESGSASLKRESGNMSNFAFDFVKKDAGISVLTSWP